MDALITLRGNNNKSSLGVLHVGIDIASWMAKLLLEESRGAAGINQVKYFEMCTRKLHIPFLYFLLRPPDEL